MFIGKAEIPDDLYVVLIENDAGTDSEYKDGCPICWEQQLQFATLESAQSHKSRIGNRYGAVKIAKLTIIEE